MYCRTPPISAGTNEEYWAASAKSLQRQSSAPLVLSSATIAPLLPPGVKTTLLPSTSGDSAYPQLGADPPKSFSRFLCQRSLPVAVSKQPKSPYCPSAKSNSPSALGAPRGPAYPPGSPDCPSFTVQSCEPSASLSATTKLVGPLWPIVKMWSPEIATVE